jgi:hypothetical protein
VLKAKAKSKDLRKLALSDPKGVKYFAEYAKRTGRFGTSKEQKSSQATKGKGGGRNTRSERTNWAKNTDKPQRDKATKPTYTHKLKRRFAKGGMETERKRDNTHSAPPSGSVSDEKANTNRYTTNHETPCTCNHEVMSDMGSGSPGTIKNEQKKKKEGDEGVTESDRSEEIDGDVILEASEGKRGISSGNSSVTSEGEEMDGIRRPMARGLLSYKLRSTDLTLGLLSSEGMRPNALSTRAVEKWVDYLSGAVWYAWAPPQCYTTKGSLRVRQRTLQETLV